MVLRVDPAPAKAATRGIFVVDAEISGIAEKK
jgi:hypothetical protein